MVEELYFPCDKKRLTIYHDELHLLVNMDGSPVEKESLEYNTNYKFHWEDGNLYTCHVSDIPGKNEPSQN